MDPRRQNIRRIMISVNVIDGIYAAVAKKIGVKENTLTLLYALDDGQPHCQKAICREWLIPKTTLNTIVRECRELGYLSLGTGSKEKEICLTEAGRAYAASVLEPVYALEARAIAAVSPAFLSGLEAFTEQLKKEAHEFIHEP